MSEYTLERKKKLAKELQEIKSKKFLVDVFHAIKSDSPEVSENSNGLFLMFESLSDDTYEKLEKMLDKRRKKLRKRSDSASASATMGDSENKTYRPYYHDEFPSERNMSPRIRFNNKEKALLKRKQYDKEIGDDEEYADFDVAAFTESEKKPKKGGRKTKTKPKKTT